MKVNEIFMFDADGVITALTTRKIEQEEIIEFIIQILTKGEPVAINTGSAVPWIKNRLINPIFQKITNKQILKNFIISAEKGGVLIEFDEKGNEEIIVDSSLNISDAIKNRIREMVSLKFSDKLFYDEDKLTMITVEKKPETTLGAFNQIHNQLDIEIAKILEELDTEKKLKFVPTTLDTDIENKNVGKNFGAGKILNWLNSKNIQPQAFITLGDSLSDLDMAKYLYEQKINVKFVFVGTSKISNQDYNFPIIITNAKYDKGTLEYIKSI